MNNTKGALASQLLKRQDVLIPPNTRPSDR